MTSEGGEVSLSNVGELRVVDLKEELKSRGLATDGKKVSVMFTHVITFGEENTRDSNIIEGQRDMSHVGTSR